MAAVEMHCGKMRIGDCLREGKEGADEKSRKLGRDNRERTRDGRKKEKELHKAGRRNW